MASTHTHSWLNRGIVPVFPYESKSISVALVASATLAKGTVMGEIQKTDTYSLATGSQASGSFTLTFGGVTTASIAYNATAGAVQTALLAISTVGTGNATVVLASGTPATDAVYTITFTGTLAYGGSTGTLGALTATLSSLATPGNASLTQTVVGQRLGTYKLYADANTDGSQHAKGILEFDCATDASGNITLGAASGGGEHGQTQKTAPMFVKGTFQTSELTGLDAAAVADLGRIIEGTITTGLLRIG